MHLSFEGFFTFLLIKACFFSLFSLTGQGFGQDFCEPLYEITRQMQAQGLEVSLVLLMDPDFPARHSFVRHAIHRMGEDFIDTFLSCVFYSTKWQFFRLDWSCFL